MSTAVSVGNVEPKNLDWLEVTDDVGSVWRYEKRAGLPLTTDPHIEGDWKGGATIITRLVRDVNGVAKLTQEEEGLPKLIIVDVIENASNSTYFSGKYQYEQAS